MTPAKVEAHHLTKRFKMYRRASGRRIGARAVLHEANGRRQVATEQQPGAVGRTAQGALPLR